MKTLEQRNKISEGLKKAWASGEYENRVTKGWPGNNKGISPSKKVKQQISNTLKGRKLSDEHRKNIGLSKLGDKHPNWKGVNAGYFPKHDWVRKHSGKAKECWNLDCENKSIKYHWANLSGKYLRDIKDWAQLCVKCHSQYDHNLIKLNLKERVKS